jgi:quinol monooxygenase YgiN
MIHSTIRVVLNRKKQEDALIILRSLAERTRVLPGCLACRVYRDVQEKSALLFDQIWKSEEDLNRHIRSNEYRNVLLVMEMAVEKPEVRFETISSLSDLETIEKLRIGSVIAT